MNEKFLGTALPHRREPYTLDGKALPAESRRLETGCEGNALPTSGRPVAS